MTRLDTLTETSRALLPLCTRTLLLSAALGLPLAPAAAQCNTSRTGTPDFDQRRLGLPNDGQFYCTPTAVANFLALLANSGYPEAFDVPAGGMNWQHGGLFGMVSGRIGALGNQMSTDPFSGTNLANARAATQQWLDQRAPGEFVVLGYFAYEDYFPTPHHLYQAQSLGGYVAPTWGRYQPDGTGFTRSGGHMVSMTVMQSACSASPKIMWRDPDDAGPVADTFQSWFSSRAAFLIPTPGHYRSSGNAAHAQGVLYRFSDSDNRMLDGYMVIMPLKYTTPAQMPGLVQAHNPVQPIGLLLPAWQKIQVPTTGEFEDLVIDARMLAYYASTAADGVTPARVWRLDAVDGDVTPLYSPASAGPLATGRFGELYIIDGRTVISMNTWAEMPTTVASSLLPAAADAIAYDDTSDTLVALNISQRKLMRIDRHLAGLAQVYSLPAALPLGPEASMAVGPAGHIYLASSAADAIYELTEDPAAGNYTHAEVVIGIGAIPLGVQVDDRNNVFFIKDDVIHELEKDASGAWGPAPSSTLAGKPARRRLSIARGRTNFDFAAMSGPEFHELAPADPPGIPDCYANCDGSTNHPILNVDDFTCFINAFAAAQSLTREDQILHYANCDESTASPVLNVDDFTCFINAFAQGCP